LRVGAGDSFENDVHEVELVARREFEEEGVGTAIEVEDTEFAGGGQGDLAGRGIDWVPNRVFITGKLRGGAARAVEGFERDPIAARCGQVAAKRDVVRAIQVLAFE
jgi:hypothetical protein